VAHCQPTVINELGRWPNLASLGSVKGERAFTTFWRGLLSPGAISDDLIKTAFGILQFDATGQGGRPTEIRIAIVLFALVSEKHFDAITPALLPRLPDDLLDMPGRLVGLECLIFDGQHVVDRDVWISSGEEKHGNGPLEGFQGPCLSGRRLQVG